MPASAIAPTFIGFRLPARTFSIACLVVSFVVTLTSS